MIYYSPGVEYLCPSCNSNIVRFVFDANCKDWSEAMKWIRAKKVILSDSLDAYKTNTKDPKWICRECHGCGIIEIPK